MDAGESVGDLLRALRGEVGDELITALVVMRAASGVGLGTARLIVEPWWFDREPRDHLLLPDLRWLAEVEAAPCLRTAHLELRLTAAMIDRRPLLRLTQISARQVGLSTNAGREVPESGWYGPDASVDAVRGAIAALPPRWATEVEVVRDDPEGLVVRFPRVAEALARTVLPAPFGTP